jgi:hypothetical protein
MSSKTLKMLSQKNRPSNLFKKDEKITCEGNRIIGRGIQRSFETKISPALPLAISIDFDNRK